MERYQVIIQRVGDRKTIYMNTYTNAYTALRHYYKAKRNKQNSMVRFCVTNKNNA